jgi:methylase of polypeptide subunit release factors
MGKNKMKSKIKTVFTPNATSQLIVDEVVKHIKKKIDILDLGCGDGFIGLNIYKKRKNKIKSFSFSDISKKATNRCEANAKKEGLKIIIKNGSMFGPWAKQKFDLIVESVSAISEPVANWSPWYNKNITCKAGDDGTELVNDILKEGKNFLNKGGKIIFPIVSLSKKEKIIAIAKKNYRSVKLLSSKDWPLPKTMYKYEKQLEILKKKKLIDYKKRFGIILYTSYIFVAIK